MILEGKIIDFLGDSITEGSGVTDIPNNRYDHVLAREAKLKKTYNYGIGGTRLSHQSKPSAKPRHDLCFAGRAYDLCPDADIIVVYGGVNDYLHGDAPLGEVGDETPATFHGAVHFLMKLLKETYPKAQIVFMTPAHCHCYGVDDSVPSPHPNKCTPAHPLSDYVDAVVLHGKELGIPVLNLYESLGINATCPADREAYTVDGLHLNDKGHAVLAKRLREFLEAL